MKFVDAEIELSHPLHWKWFPSFLMKNVGIMSKYFKEEAEVDIKSA
jgi:hypothetical protein